MEAALLLRSLGGLLAVLGALSGALWLVKRYDLRLPGRVGGARQARLALVERLALDARRTLVLVRRDGEEHLLLLAPEGVVPVGGPLPVAVDPAPDVPASARSAPAGIAPEDAGTAAASGVASFAAALMRRRDGAEASDA